MFTFELYGKTFEAPDTDNWAAIDSDGFVYSYQNEPWPSEEVDVWTWWDDFPHCLGALPKPANWRTELYQLVSLDDN